MLVARPLHVVTIISVVLSWAAAAPALALSRSEPIAGPSSAFVQLAARKGTRNYVPDDGGTAEAPQETAPGQTDPAADVKALEECIAIWDAGTHITKSKWREICERQIKARGAHSGY
jgi:hypothetical protein